MQGLQKENKKPVGKNCGWESEMPAVRRKSFQADKEEVDFLEIVNQKDN